MSKIVVLVGSGRNGGNTQMLADAFCEGAAIHNTVEIISVADYKVEPCIGCNTCFKREDYACFKNDDMQIIYKKLSDADMLVIASPVYFYGISSQLKAIIDRLHTPLRDTFKIKRAALLLVAAATLPQVFDAIKMEYNLILDFFHIENVGEVLVRGVKDKGDIKNNPALTDAYELGKKLTDALH